MFKCILLLNMLILACDGVTRIYFTHCGNLGWTCNNNIPNDIEFSCRSANQHDIIAHIKDFHTGEIISVTIHECRSVKIYIDCPQLLVPSGLQHFTIKSTGKLEFATLIDFSSKQTPANFTIEDVQDIPSIPTGTFKSPSNSLERKCFGNTPAVQSIVIRNSTVNTIEHHAIHNVTDVKRILFEKVVINNVNEQGIYAVMESVSSEFMITNSKLNTLHSSAINVKAHKVMFDSNFVQTMHPHSINASAAVINFVNNTVQEVNENGLNFKASAINISRNTLKKFKTGAMLNSKCVRKRSTPKYFNFSNNTIENIEVASLYFDITSCKTLRSPVSVRHNIIDCRCTHISWLNTDITASSITPRHDINNLILNKENNNTCHSAPCVLPVEVVKMLTTNNMCHLNLAPQVMCFVYYDKRVNYNNDVIMSNNIESEGSNAEDGVTTEQTAAFYMIRQASIGVTKSSAEANVLDKDSILNDNRLNMTNRTTIPMVFDLSKDFVETLRHTQRGAVNLSATSAGSVGGPYAVAQCNGVTCTNNVANNKQKALDFYKYLYAQLHSDKT